ncbi:hypothetical protein DL764_005683 [Monosporascus ibericus]|uniref:Uncharacterized protein n=1 Tax=Monosporascus ibericus TaxID=155417 RepID=A0A4Q4TC11_9PEZI|nr:hypothetical protein DL764_005683 [Monosporascus ibericus]
MEQYAIILLGILGALAAVVFFFLAVYGPSSQRELVISHITSDYRYTPSQQDAVNGSYIFDDMLLPGEAVIMQCRTTATPTCRLC